MGPRCTLTLYALQIHIIFSLTNIIDAIQNREGKQQIKCNPNGNLIIASKPHLNIKVSKFSLNDEEG